MRFVALDLETTGLDTKNDKIIEIAAIAFSLSQENWKFQIIDKEERTMLVNPGIPLTEEISMITGITDAMLEGRVSWDDIREKIRDFIGDAIIVGHNVLFDIAMLDSHGIDLHHNGVLDTFELSEILSQDIESLNLWFLIGKYGLSDGESEHRALDDTRLSLSLFLFYLDKIQNLSSFEKSIFALMAQKEEKPSISYLCDILYISIDRVFDFPILDQISELTHTEIQKNVPHTPDTKLYSLSADSENEREIYHTHLRKSEKTHIVVLTPKVVENTMKIVENAGFSVVSGLHFEKFCSLKEVANMVKNEQKWSRKMNIFLGKILFWLHTTKTGLLDELKFYGVEREFLPFFRTTKDENHIFRSHHDSLCTQSEVILYDLQTYIELFDTLPSPDTLFLKDIASFEDITRRSLSRYVDFGQIIPWLLELENTKELIDALHFIVWIYEWIAPRPTGPMDLPPGNHGETYFFAQSEIWEKWRESLVLANTLLERIWKNWRNTFQPVHSREERILTFLDKQIPYLISFHKIDMSVWMILSITESGTKCHYIPRSVWDSVSMMFHHAKKNLIAYGYGIDTPIIQGFLDRETGIDVSDIISFHGQKTMLFTDWSNMIPGTVILTTSMKHIREIWKNLQKNWYTVFMQWISWWKSKMLSLFSENIDKAVLIGLIDTWRDDLELWKVAQQVIVSKVPFDPPTDPYFLAKTSGMTNNFSLYSEPLALIRLNLLIWRIMSVSSISHIFCWDNRIQETIWWKQLAENLL
jgi:DNA polymerase III epsilon subunit family exonuclease